MPAPASKSAEVLSILSALSCPGCPSGDSVNHCPYLVQITINQSRQFAHRIL